MTSLGVQITTINGGDLILLKILLHTTMKSHRERGRKRMNEWGKIYTKNLINELRFNVCGDGNNCPQVEILLHMVNIKRYEEGYI